MHLWEDDSDIGFVDWIMSQKIAQRSRDSVAGIDVVDTVVVDSVVADIVVADIVMSIVF